MKRIVLAALILLSFAGMGDAVVVDFTGGTAHLYNGTDVVLNNNLSYTDQVVYYVEDGFKFSFVGGYGTVGDYYYSLVGGTPNDVVHAHWGGVSSMTITKVDGTAFDLNYIDITSNTTVGGGQQSGLELSYIRNNSGHSMLLPSSDWGFDKDYFGALGDGVARLWLDNNFDNVTFVTFTSQNAYCFGMDNFYIDEPPPPPNGVPEPTTLLLFGAGLVGLAGYGRKKLN